MRTIVEIDKVNKQVKIEFYVDSQENHEKVAEECLKQCTLLHKEHGNVDVYLFADNDIKDELESRLCTEFQDLQGVNVSKTFIVI